MVKIVAIGGGEIGRPHENGGFYPVETTSIDKEIISLTGKNNPKLLFIPTASYDSKGYCEVIEKHFGRRLGCKVNYLLLREKKYSKKELENKILNTDIIYVGGGNTLYMMTTWRRLGVDKILKRAIKKGVVLSGLSAGANCWFRECSSDARIITGGGKDLIKVTSMGLIDALYSPHIDAEKMRKPQLKRLMKRTKGVAIATENCCAIEIIDNKYRIISSKKNKNAYKTYWSKGKYYEEIIPKTNEFQNLNLLLKK
jgi:dipeptidase E